MGEGLSIRAHTLTRSRTVSRTHILTQSNRRTKSTLSMHTHIHKQLLAVQPTTHKIDTLIPPHMHAHQIHTHVYLSVCIVSMCTCLNKEDAPPSTATPPRPARDSTPDHSLRLERVMVCLERRGGRGGVNRVVVCDVRYGKSV